MLVNKIMEDMHAIESVCVCVWLLHAGARFETDNNEVVQTCYCEFLSPRDHTLT